MNPVPLSFEPLAKRVRRASAAGPALPPNPSLLDRVLAPGGLSVVYQPIFDLTTSPPCVVAFEALARWEAGSSREAPDGLFEPASRQGEEPVFDRAAAVIALADVWQLPGELPIHINVHASTLSRDDAFPDHLDQVAADCGLSLSRLIVEIGEHADLIDETLFLSTLSRLRRRGVGVALDDIGLGESTFRMMLLSRPGLLKVDGYLVQGIARDPVRRALLGGLHQMARSCSALLVAEGVEKEEDLAVLRSLQIEFAQGYLLGRPEAAAKLLADAAVCAASADTFCALPGVVEIAELPAVN